MAFDRSSQAIRVGFDPGPQFGAEVRLVAEALFALFYLMANPRNRKLWSGPGNGIAFSVHI